MASYNLTQIQQLLDRHKAAQPQSHVPPPPAPVVQHETFAPPRPPSPISASNPFTFMPSTRMSVLPQPTRSFDADYHRVRLAQAAAANEAARATAAALKAEAKAKEKAKADLAAAASSVLQRSKRSFAIDVEQHATPIDPDADPNDAPIPIAALTTKPRIVPTRSPFTSTGGASTKHRLLGSHAANVRVASQSRWVGRHAAEETARLEAAKAKRLAQAKADAIRRHGIELIEQAERRKTLQAHGITPGKSAAPVTSITNSRSTSAAASSSTRPSSLASSSAAHRKPGQIGITLNNDISEPAHTRVPVRAIGSTNGTARLTQQSKSGVKRTRAASPSSSESDQSSDDDSVDSSFASSARSTLARAKKQRRAEQRSPIAVDPPKKKSTPAPTPTPTTTHLQAKPSTSRSLTVDLTSPTSRVGSTHGGSSYAAAAATALPVRPPTTAPASSTAPTVVPSPAPIGVLPVIPLPAVLASSTPLTLSLRQTFVDSLLRLALRSHPDRFDADQLHPSLPGNALILRCEWQILEHVLRSTEHQPHDMQVSAYKHAAARVLGIMRATKDIAHVAQLVARTPNIATIGMNDETTNVVKSTTGTTNLANNAWNGAM